MNNLSYLFAGYTAVWLIIGFYLFILIRRNRKLGRQVELMEKRLHDFEKDKNPGRFTGNEYGAG